MEADSYHLFDLLSQGTGSAFLGQSNVSWHTCLPFSSELISLAVRGRGKTEGISGGWNVKQKAEFM